MDIITHTLSGLLFGTVAASFTSENGWKKKAGVIISGGTGGCLPDIDGISLWSGFDSTVGRFFQLSLSGHEIYFSKLWYSHHGFFHSIAAICSYISIWVIVKSIISPTKIKTSLHHIMLIVAFAVGYFIHILEDMPTPDGSWGGVNIFWPSSQWVGGTGQIWWWNNYDIFLIVLSALVLNLVILIMGTKYKLPRLIPYIIFIVSFLFSYYQITTRTVNFNHSSFQSLEQESLEIQRKILGQTIFNIMIVFDEKVKLNF